MKHPRHILCLNSGSSSLKFALYRMGDGEEMRLAEGAVERIGLEGGHAWLRQEVEVEVEVEAKAEVQRYPGDFPDHARAVEEAFTRLKDLRLPAPDAVGHRVVHGGATYSAPAIVNAELLAALKRFIPFAPLHLPGEILGIEAVAARFPALPQVACFDTAFHRRMPELAQRFPLPRALYDEGVRRYGFHGLSYEYIVETLGATMPSRVIIAHLGNGASMAAIKDGTPLDTTMGMTPAGGFMMGTRTGDLDPGILIHLMREKGYDSAKLDELINNASGLLGVSGLSSDMKTLLDAREKNPQAAQAVEMFCYQLRKEIGSFAAALGSLDLLVFTGGIGERAAAVRAEICRGLAHLGVALDAAANERHDDTITAPASRCRVRVIPTNEDVVIARQAHRLLG